MSRSIHTYLGKVLQYFKVIIISHQYAAAHISLALCAVEKETAIRTDAALTVHIDTPPGTKETPEGISVTVELVVYLYTM